MYLQKYFMSNQNQRPTLQGQKIKTRKRGKYVLWTCDGTWNTVIIVKYIYCSPFVILLRSLFVDEKEKYDPAAFRDAILQGFDEANGDLEQVNAHL